MDQTQKDKDEEDRKAAKDDTALERTVRKIVPPSHEVSDDDLKDPGKMTPGAPPVDNKS